MHAPRFARDEPYTRVHEARAGGARSVARREADDYIRYAAFSVPEPAALHRAQAESTRGQALLKIRPVLYRDGMKRAKRFGMFWWTLNAGDHRRLAPRFFAFMLLTPFLLWGLIWLVNRLSR